MFKIFLVEILKWFAFFLIYYDMNIINVIILKKIKTKKKSAIISNDKKNK
jgi:hypothetical protein